MPPEPGTMKLNFDGASKDNPRSLKVGEVLRNSEGTIISMFASNLGHNTNTGEELEGFIQGIQMDRCNTHFPPFVINH
jgi:ribonuclease HI